MIHVFGGLAFEFMITVPVQGQMALTSRIFCGCFVLCVYTFVYF